jgi:lipopolysaccharide export system permease protein
VKTIHRYLLSSLIINLGLTLIVFTSVLLLGNIFKDLMDLLSNRSVGIASIAYFFLLLLPFVLSFSMPMGLLASTLLAMGRFSADQELNACRACGISYLKSVYPILGFAALLSLITLYLNASLAPWARFEFNRAFVELALQNPMALLEEGQFINEFNDKSIFIGSKDTRRNTLQNIRVIFKEGDAVKQEIHAQRGTVSIDKKLLKLKIQLFEARIDERDPSNPHRLDKRTWATTAQEFPLELDLTELINQRRTVKEVHHHSSLELLRQSWTLRKEGIHPTPYLVEIHKRAALAFACISFVLIALPLGVQVQRRETSIGIFISLGLTVLYYILVLFAESLKRHPHLYPEFLIWLPNLVFQGIGIYLIIKQNRV